MAEDQDFELLANKPKSKLFQMSIDDYLKLITGGYFWELYPEATGKYKQDVELSRNKQFKIEL
jgi:hypothetical protein